MTKGNCAQTEIKFIEGDVFDAKSFGADALIVFYAGLSAIKAAAVKHQSDANFNAAFGLTRYIDTNAIKINSVEDMRKLLNHVLNELAGSNCRKIAMNGIRAYERPDVHTRSEKYQIQFIEEWLALHPGVFEQICLIDKRDGFNHADDRI